MPTRDLDRFREILLFLEEAESNDGWVNIRNDQFFVDADTYQIKLMEQAGFVDADAHALGTPLPGRMRITYSGHDYLDAIKTQKIWDKTRKVVADEGGSMSLELVKAVATAFLKKQIEEKTGLEL